MNLSFKVLNEDAQLPEYKTDGSVGMDISTIEGPIILNPGEFKIFHTGLACSVDKGYEVQVRPRSGLACKNGITVINTPGTVDSDYRGEIGVGLINLSNEQQVITKGERIAQLVVNKVERPYIQIVTELDETERGEGGFGSTGVN